MDEICKECRIRLTGSLYRLLCPYCRSLSEEERIELLRELYNIQIDNED